VSRGRAAQLARFKIEHPLWTVRREPDGSYVAVRATTVIAATTLERLAVLIGRSEPDQDSGGE
jgi:hypothetical protein